MKRPLMKLATVAALAAGIALAQTPAAPSPQQGQAKPAVRPRAGLRKRMIQALHLSDTQKQQAKAIFQQARQDAQPIATQLKQNREALTAAVKANNAAQIQSLAAEQGNLRGQALAIRSEAMAKFYTSLTPEQRSRADQIQQRIRQRMQQRLTGNNG